MLNVFLLTKEFMNLIKLFSSVSDLSSNVRKKRYAQDLFYRLEKIKFRAQSF